MNMFLEKESNLTKLNQERKNGLNCFISITKVEKNFKLPPIGRKQSRPRTSIGKF